MVWGIHVLAIPAAREINLCPDARRAWLQWQSIVTCTDSVEVQAQESNSLLRKTIGIIRSQSEVTTDHAKIIWESRSVSGRVIEQVVDDCTTIETSEASVCPLEVQMGIPVVGFILWNRNRTALALPEDGSAKRSKVATTKD
jgi:hypothetical protein